MFPLCCYNLFSGSTKLKQTDILALCHTPSPTFCDSDDSSHHLGCLFAADIRSLIQGEYRKPMAAHAIHPLSSGGFRCLIPQDNRLPGPQGSLLADIGAELGHHGNPLNWRGREEGSLACTCKYRDTHTPPMGVSPSMLMTCTWGISCRRNPPAPVCIMLPCQRSGCSLQMRRGEPLWEFRHLSL